MAGSVEYTEKLKNDFPELDDILKAYELSKNIYDYYLGIITFPPPQTIPGKSSEVTYDANVSKLSRQY